MRSVELFSGAGGLALGTHQAGFRHLAIVEHEHNACDTLRRNREIGLVDWPIHELDVADFDYTSYPIAIDLIAGGAPCQPFSLGGKHKGQSDRRNMFPEVFRAVRELKPRAFLLENVKGLTRTSFRPYFDYILSQLHLPHLTPLKSESWEQHKNRLIAHQSRGRPICARPWDEAAEFRYNVKWQVVNVADHGIPQQRHRVFIVGLREDEGLHWNFPSPTHSEDALLYAQYVDGTYWIEHGLDQPPIPTRLQSRIAKLARKSKPLLERWQTVRDAIRDLPEPVDYDPEPAIKNHVGVPGARSYKGHTGSPWDWPAKTIKAGDHGNPGGENMLRRDNGSVRYFTSRELARLQTFPDNWQFPNSWTECRRQLGNAVPVLMAEILARHLYRVLDSCHNSRGEYVVQRPLAVGE